MAKKNSQNAGGDLSFDTRTGAVMASNASQDGVLEKVKQVQELVNGHKKENIVLALEFYNQDVQKTVQAFHDDGAKEALSQWTHSGSKHTGDSEPTSAKQKSNTKKKKKSKPPPASQPPPFPSKAGPGLSSTEQATAAAEPAEFLASSPSEAAAAAADPLPLSIDTTSPPVTYIGSKSLPQKHQQRPQALHVSKPRERTVSEQSNASSISKGPHGGMEKSLKDLNRQIVSLERLKSVLREKSEQGDKDIKEMFKKFAELLENREVELMFNLQKAQDLASEALAQRQKTAKELKRRADRAPSMTDNEKAELRADIKHFVSDRKIDEDLSITQRFVCKRDEMENAIRTFGDVIPPKTSYSQRRPSVSSVSSVDPLSPTTPVTPFSPNMPSSAPPPPSTGASRKQYPAPSMSLAQHAAAAQAHAAAFSQSSGAKVLSQSDSLTKYEIQNKDKLAEVKVKPQLPKQNSSPEDQRDMPSRNARRRQRQRDRQRQIKKTTAEHDDDDDKQSPRRNKPQDGGQGSPRRNRPQGEQGSPMRNKPHADGPQGGGSPRRNKPQGERASQGSPRRNRPQVDGPQGRNKPQGERNSQGSPRRNKPAMESRPEKPKAEVKEASAVIPPASSDKVEVVQKQNGEQQQEQKEKQNGDASQQQQNGQLNGHHTPDDALPQRKPRQPRQKQNAAAAESAGTGKAEMMMNGGGDGGVMNGDVVNGAVVEGEE